MPRVPMLEQPQVAERPLPTPYDNTRNTPREYSNAVGQGLQSLGSAIRGAGHDFEQLVHQEKEKVNAAQQFDVYSQIGEWKKAKLYDPETGYLATQGELALGKSGEKPVSDQNLDDFDKFTQGVVDKLADDEQRGSAKKLIAQERESVFREMSSHERQQHKVVAEGKFRAAISTSAGEAANSYRDGGLDLEHLSQARTRGEQAILVQGQNEGWSGPEVDRELSAYRTKIHTTMLKQLTNAETGNPALAAQYLKQYGPEIDGQVRADQEWDAVVSLAGTNRQAELEARKFLGEVKGPGGWLNGPLALSKVDAMEPGPLQDRTRARVRERLAEAENDKKKAVEEHFNAGLAYLQTKGTLYGMDPDLERWLRNQNNDPMAWHRLEAMAKADKQDAENQPPTAEQERAYAKFRIFAADNPDRVGTMSEATLNNEWMPQLAKRDRRMAVEVLSQLHTIVGKPEKLSPLEDRLVLTLGRKAELFPNEKDPNKWTDEQFSLYYRMSQVMSEKALDFKQHNGKPPPPDVVQKWATDQVRDAKISGSGVFGTGLFQKKTTRLEEEMKGQTFVPDEEREKIESALKQRGKEVTPEAVQQVYRSMQKPAGTP